MKKQFKSNLVAELNIINEKIFHTSEKRNAALVDVLDKYYPTKKNQPFSSKSELDKIWISYRENKLEKNKWFQTALLHHRLTNLYVLENFHNDGSYSHYAHLHAKKHCVIKVIICQIAKVCGWNQHLKHTYFYGNIEKSSIDFSNISIKVSQYNGYLTLDIVDMSNRDSQTENQKIQIQEIINDLYNWLSKIKAFSNVTKDNQNRYIRLTEKVQEPKKMYMKSPLELDKNLKHLMDSKINELNAEISKLESEKSKIIEEMDLKIIDLNQSIKSINVTKKLLSL